MMNNDSALQLSNVLNQECTRSQVHCQSKKRALEIISELAAKQLSLPPQVVFEAILTREKMGSTGIGNGIAIPHGWRTKRFVVAFARRRAMKSCMRSSPKQEAAMTHNGSRTLSFIVLRRNGTWY